MIKASNIELEKYQHSNGLFPASSNSENPEMCNFWIRDNYYVYLAVRGEVKQKMIYAFQNLVDYLEYLGKFNYKPTQDWMHIHPRYDENLKEIKGGFGWVQNDSVGNLLEILSDVGDTKRAKLIVDYLNTIEYWNCPDFGFWEDGPKQIRSSSLGSCIRGLETYKKIQGTKKSSKELEEMINKGYGKLCSLLPHETKSRMYDLALLSLIYPNKLNPKIVTPDIKKTIIADVQSYLGGAFGVKRYIGDSWNGKNNSFGKDKEMQWTMGLSWLYLITGKREYILRAIYLKKRYGKMPEGIINGSPNCTKHLLWSEAMYKLALDKFIKEEKS